VWRKRVHFLVCQNERPPGGPKTCCARGLGPRVRGRLLGHIKGRSLFAEVQATGTSCLGVCRPEGVAVVVYPEGSWYLLPTVEDADLFFEAALSGDLSRLQNLRLPEPEDAPSAE
jgi:(2Fe-2S) ferredoxin